MREIISEIIPGRRACLLDISECNEDLIEKLELLPSFTIFHSTEWLQVLCQAYHFKAYYAVIWNQNNIVAAVPLVETRGVTGKRKVIALPFSDECAPLAEGIKDLDFLFGFLLQQAALKKWQSIEYRGGDWSHKTDLEKKSFWGHRIDLNKSEKMLYEALAASTRRNIRKAKKQGVTIRITTRKSDLGEFYKLNCLTRKRHGLPPQPRRFFDEIKKQIFDKEKGFILSAYYRNMTIASYIFFTEKNNAVYKYGASDHNMQHLRSNDLLMWTGIEYLAKQGYASLSLGRTDLHHNGLRRFKSGFAPSEYIIRYYQYDTKQSIFLGPCRGFSPKMTAFFRIMPGWMLRVIGEWVYRYAA